VGGCELNSFDSNYEICGNVINRGCTNTGATTFCTVAYNICGPLVRNLLMNSAVASRVLENFCTLAVSTKCGNF